MVPPIRWYDFAYIRNTKTKSAHLGSESHFFGVSDENSVKDFYKGNCTRGGQFEIKKINYNMVIVNSSYCYPFIDHGFCWVLGATLRVVATPGLFVFCLSFRKKHW